MRLLSEQDPGVPLAVDDDELVRQAQRDLRAFAPLYRRFAVRVYRYVYSRVSNVADAEEITSQVFVDAMQGLQRYRPRGSFAGWLLAIARRRCADHYRRRVHSPLRDDLADASSRSPMDQALRNEALQGLARVLEKLSEQERELLRLRYAAELSHREIGYLLGRNEGAIKTAMSRLMHKARALWEAEHV